MHGYVIISHVAMETCYSEVHTNTNCVRCLFKANYTKHAGGMYSFAMIRAL